MANKPAAQFEDLTTSKNTAAQQWQQSTAAPKYQGPEKPKTGYERYFEKQLGGSYLVGTHSGANGGGRLVYKGGMLNGKSRQEAAEFVRKKYAAMTPEERLQHENEAQGNDIRSDAEREREANWHQQMQNIYAGPRAQGVPSAAVPTSGEGVRDTLTGASPAQPAAQPQTPPPAAAPAGTASAVGAADAQPALPSAPAQPQFAAFQNLQRDNPNLTAQNYADGDRQISETGADGNSARIVGFGTRGTGRAPASPDTQAKLDAARAAANKARGVTEQPVAGYGGSITRDVPVNNYQGPTLNDKERMLAMRN